VREGVRSAAQGLLILPAVTLMLAAGPASADVVVLGTRDIVQFRNGRTVKGIVEEPNHTIHATTGRPS
jgi:hypothetical protein